VGGDKFVLVVPHEREGSVLIADAIASSVSPSLSRSPALLLSSPALPPVPSPSRSPSGTAAVVPAALAPSSPAAAAHRAIPTALFSLHPPLPRGGGSGSPPVVIGQRRRRGVTAGRGEACGAAGPPARSRGARIHLHPTRPVVVVRSAARRSARSRRPISASTASRPAPAAQAAAGSRDARAARA